MYTINYISKIAPKLCDRIVVLIINMYKNSGYVIIFIGRHPTYISDSDSSAACYLSQST